MSQATKVPYKELQKEAKRHHIPANMKRSFLESAIEAFLDNDHEKLNSIVDRHKSQRKRRASTSNRLAKNFNFTSSHAGEMARKADVAVSSPVQASSSSSREHVFYKLSGDDDDDSSNFHPDSTSTPNRSSPIVNVNHYPSNCGSSRYRADDFRPAAACQLSNYPNSRVSSTLVPTIRVQEMDFNDEGDLPRINDETDRNFVSITKQSSTPGSSQLQSVYDTNIVNLNFIRQYSHSFQTVRSNTRYLETNADTVPISATYERTPAVQVENSSYMPRLIEKQCPSYCLRNVPYSNDIDTRKNTIPPEASCSLNDTTVDNFRRFLVNAAPNVNRGHMNGNIADATCVNAEFDSDSDTETLSLTEEMVNFFDPRVENKRSSFTASNVVSCILTPNSNASSSIPRNSSSVFANTNLQLATWNNYEKECCRDTDATNLTSLPGAAVASSNTAAAGYTTSTLLPSISTILPEYKIQAYCQGYSGSCQDACDFAEPYNANSQPGWYNAATVPIATLQESSFSPPPPYVTTNKSGGDDGGIVSDAFRRSSASAVEQEAGFSAIPFIGANSSQLNDVPGSGHGLVSASVIEDLPSASSSTSPSPFDIVFDEAMREMQTCSTNASVSKTSNSTACETLLEQQTTSLVLKRETISIRGLTADVGEAMKDVRCKSLEIKVNEDVGKGTAASTVCRNTTYAPPASAVADNSRVNALVAAGDEDSDGGLSASSYRSCRNEVYGCNVITNNVESARTHEKECLHQVVRCPSDECNWCGVVSTLTDHVYVCHKSDLNVGNDLVYVINRNEREASFVTVFFQLHEGTIFVITLRVNEKIFIATMRYLPEIETADYRNKCVKGAMQLVYFTTSSKVETKCWRGVARPYFEDDKTLYQTGNVLQSGIGNSKNVVIRILID